jgi:hypothetical protein
MSDTLSHEMAVGDKRERSMVCECNSRVISGVYRWIHRKGLYPAGQGPVCAECLSADAKGFDFSPLNQSPLPDQLLLL